LSFTRTSKRYPFPASRVAESNIYFANTHHVVEYVISLVDHTAADCSIYKIFDFCRSTFRIITGNSNVIDDGNNLEDIVKAGSMEWAISASTDRQVMRSRAATATVTGIPNSANDTAIGGAGRKTGIFGFGKRG
jgi:hypothetical protein